MRRLLLLIGLCLGSLSAADTLVLSLDAVDSTASATIDLNLAIAPAPSSSVTQATWANGSATAAGSINLQNAVLISVTPNNGSPAAAWNIRVQAQNPGSVTVSIPAGALTAGVVANTAISQTVTYDPTGPVLSDLGTRYVTSNVPTVKFTANEPLGSTVVTSKIHLTGGGGAATVDDATTSGNELSIKLQDVTASITIALDSGVVTDALGNPSAAVASATYTFDNEKPTISFTAVPGSITLAGTVVVTIAASEAVTMIKSGEAIKVSDGTLGDLVGSGASRTIAWTIAPPQALLTEASLTVATTSVKDLAGQSLAQDQVLTLPVDQVAPTLTPAAHIHGKTVRAVDTVTFAASENLSSMVAAGQVTSDHCTIGSVTTSGNILSVTVLEPQTGSITITAKPGTVRDVLGNPSVTAAMVFTLDDVPPTLTTPTGTVSCTAAGIFVLGFNEGIKLRSKDDFTVPSGTIDDVVAVDSSTLSVSYSGLAASGSLTWAAGAVSDLVGNPIAAGSLSLAFDDKGPVVTVSPNPGPSATGSLTLAITTDEAATPHWDRITVPSGTLTGSASTTRSFLLTLTGLSEGTVTFLPGAFVDDLGNGSDKVEVPVMDTTAPFVSESNPGPGSISKAPLNQVRFVFSEPLASVMSSAITVSGFTKGIPSIDDRTLTIPVTAPQAGGIRVTLAAGAVHDLSDNPSSPYDLSFTYDPDLPKATVLSPGSVSQASGSVTLSFTEPITLSSTSAFTLTSGTITGATVSSDGSSVVIGYGTLTGSGLLSWTSAAVTDRAGNPVVAGSKILTYDATGPVLTVTTSQVVAGSATLAIATDEDATPDWSRITVPPGTVATGSISAERDFVLSLSNLSEGNVTFQSGAFVDVLGNGSLTVNVPVLDVTPPVWASTLPAQGSIHGSVTQAVFTANEAIQLLDPAHISAGGSTIGTVQVVGNELRIPLLNLIPGPVTIAVPAGVVEDITSNDMTSGLTVAFTYDPVAPKQISFVPGSVNLAAGSLTLGFDKPVVLGTGGFHLTSGSILSTAINDRLVILTYESLTASGSLTWAAGAVRDLAGNQVAAGSVPLVYDAQGPQITVTPDPGYTAAGSVTLAITTDEASTVDWDLVQVPAGWTANGTTTDNRSFQYAVVATGSGAVQFLDGAFKDDLNNPSLARTVQVVQDATAPLLTAPSLAPQVNALASVVFTANETLGNTVDVSRISVGGATLGTPTVSGTTVTIPLTPAPGQVTVAVGAGAVRDLSGNPTSATSSVVVIYDPVRPTVTGLTPNRVAESAGTAAGTVTLGFSEPVVLRSASDFGITSGTITPVAVVGSITNLAIAFKITASGSITWADGAVSDLAGNPIASGSTPLELDSTAPTLINIPTAFNGNNVMLTLTTSEPLSAIDPTKFTVNQGASVAATWSSTAPSTIQVDLTDAFRDLAITLAAGAMTDLVGKTSAATSFTLTFDDIKPTFKIVSDTVRTQGLLPVVVTITTVDALELPISAVTWEGGTPVVRKPTAVKTELTFNPPFATGATKLQVNVDASQVTDAAGNQAVADGVVEIPIDTVVPTLQWFDVLGTGGTATMAVLHFDEPVVFTKSLVTVTGPASIGTVTGSGTTELWLAISQTAVGTVTLTFTPGAVVDLAGNQWTEDGSTTIDLFWDYDTRPKVTKVYSKDRGTQHYQTGETIFVVVRFSKNVVVENTGTPALTLQTNRANRMATLATRPSAPTNELTFRYVVQADDYTKDLDYVGPGSLTTGGARIRFSGGTDADLTLAVPGQTGSLSQNYVDGVKDTAVIHDGKDPNTAVKPPLIDNGGDGAGCGSGSSIAVLLGGLALALRRRRQRR